ncbi:MAG: hypothetical protein C0582_01405 [Alphaproteobacteria bacterium]|nr:MAG: hypothetical protein C0582_01405 [Alphaproteobacteria bacterium]
MNEINNDEISFDVRKDQLITFYKKNKKKISNITFLIVLAVAGYFFYKSRQNEARTDAARSLYSAMMNTNTTQALKNLETIAKKSGYTYADLVKFYGATLYQKNNDLSQAREILLKTIEKTSNSEFKTIAQLRLAQVNIDLDVDLDQTEQMLRVYSLDPSSAWHVIALELMAALHLKKGNIDKAKEALHTVIHNAKAPADIKHRAEFILAAL